MDLLVWRETRPDRVAIRHWRTTKGAGAEFIVEWPAGLLPVEVESSKRVHPADAAGLRAFMSETPDRCRAGLLLYEGDGGSG